MASARLYTIVVSGERLAFTKDQLDSDPESFFVSYFLEGWRESETGEDLVVEKDPHLFRLIQAHLRGYEIFPLEGSAIPPSMSQETAMKNLLIEADFYALGNLTKKIKEEQRRIAKKKETPTRRHIFGSREGRGEWNLLQITEDRYQFLVRRAAAAKTLLLIPHGHKINDKYMPEYAWMESAAVMGGGKPKELECVLILE